MSTERKLVAEVIDLGKEVENSIEIMLGAMETRDADLARSELGTDARYKIRGTEAERDCMVLQARRALAAQHLGHILCEHICRAIVETEGYERDEDLEAVLIEMARTARNAFHEGLDIFENRDMDRARNLEARNDKVDLLHSEAMNLIANPSDSRGAGVEDSGRVDSPLPGAYLRPRRRHRGTYHLPRWRRTHRGRHARVPRPERGPRRGRLRHP